MMFRNVLLSLLVVALCVWAASIFLFQKSESLAEAQSNETEVTYSDPNLKYLIDPSQIDFEVQYSEEEWAQKLSDEEYRVLRKEGTEKPFLNKYHLKKDKGVYKCAACGQPLFSSEHKFESHSGWPSYYQPIEEDAVLYRTDNKLKRRRVELICGRCGGHLGHVFKDGPEPTGLRYCINSASLKFSEDKENK